MVQLCKIANIVAIKLSGYITAILPQLIFTRGTKDGDADDDVDEDDDDVDEDGDDVDEGGDDVDKDDDDVDEDDDNVDEEARERVTKVSQGHHSGADSSLPRSKILTNIHCHSLKRFNPPKTLRPTKILAYIAILGNPKKSDT